MSKVNLSAIRARLTKYQTTKERPKLGKDCWTQKRILDMARIWYADHLPLLEGRYEAMNSSPAALARLQRLLDRIESGMIELVGGQVVEHDTPAKRPDQIHRLQFLTTGRPVLRLGHAAQAQTLRNPFKKG